MSDVAPPRGSPDGVSSPQLEAASDEFARTVVAVGDAEEASAPTSTPSAGALIGRYIVVGEIGVGGMGRVLRAYDPKLHREVALKLLRTTGSAIDRARIVREARAMAQLSHPNVVAVYDVDETRPTFDERVPRVFVAMEYVAGRTLRDWSAERHRTWREVIEVLAQVGRALAAAHAAGLVHRDVKPSNILVGDDGRVRIGDFGLARADADAPRSADATGTVDLSRAAGRSRPGTELDDGDEDGWDTALTRADTVMGTPSYMAPEQHTGAVVDARSDQYSFCVTLWHALFGAVPFVGDDLEHIAAAKHQGPPTPPEGTDVPRWLCAVATRGLAVDPAARFASMDALLAALGADPTRRRRQWFVAAGVVAIVGGAFGLHAMDRARRVAACEREGAAIAEVWDASRRDQIEASARALGIAAAADAWDRLRPWIDRHAERWSAIRTDACLAAQVEGTMSAELLARANECLDDGREHLAALLDTLGEPSAKVLQRAVTAAAGLPTLEPCADAGALRRAPPASDAQTRREHAAISRRIADALSARAMGRYDDAVAINDEALARAEAAGWIPLAVRALVVRGQTLERMGEIDAASDALESAAYRAAVAGYDELAADATSALVAADGERRGRFDAGLRWSWLTEMFLARAGAHDDLRVATWQANLGGLQRARGDTAAALAAYGRALEIRVRVLGADHPETALVHNARGQVYLDRGELDAADVEFRRALELRELTFGSQSPLVATTLGLLGDVASRRGEHAAALASYRRALATWEAELGQGHPQVVGIYEKVGRTELAIARVPEAIAAFERGLQIAEALFGVDDPDHEPMLVGLADARLAAGDLVGARAAAERAIRLCDAKPANAEAAARGRLALARILFAAGDRASAVELATVARDRAGDSPAAAAATAWLATLPAPQ